MEHRLTAGKLLDLHGHLKEAGYATSLVREYDRGDIKAPALRIKEWDYYLIYNGRFGVAPRGARVRLYTEIRLCRISRGFRERWKLEMCTVLKS